VPTHLDAKDVRVEAECCGHAHPGLGGSDRIGVEEIAVDRRAGGDDRRREFRDGLEKTVTGDVHRQRRGEAPLGRFRHQAEL